MRGLEVINVEMWDWDYQSLRLELEQQLRLINHLYETVIQTLTLQIVLVGT